MNRAHRVVWSQVRNCFVVASEKAQAKGKPSSTRTAVAAAVAAMFLAPGVASAFELCNGVTPVTTTLTSSQTYCDQNVTINTGAGIAVTGSSTAAYVSLSAPYTSTFTNNGTISLANSSSSSGRFYGVSFNDGIAAAGRLINTGNISVNVNTSYTGTGYGIHLNGDMAGTLSNSGRIAVDVVGDTSAFAYGIYLGGDLSGTLANSGTISATASASTSYATAYGIYTQDLSGTLNNSGTISATAYVSTNSTAYAYGVYVSGDLSGTLSNSGTIRAQAFNSSYSPYAYGVYISNDLIGTLNNSGTISVNAENHYSGGSDAYAYGLYVSGNLNGTLNNSGSISAQVLNNYGSAYGVYVNNTMDGTFNNSGTISALAEAYSSSNSAGYAYGVYVNTIAATRALNNSGTISATADGSGGTAYGVYVNTLDGAINNSGTIRATGLGGVADADAYSLYVGGGSGNVNNLAGGVLDGQIFVSNSTGGSGYVNNAGIIDTRLNASTVTGNYTQSATGIFTIGAEVAASSYGRLGVSGTATLAAGTGIRVNAVSGHTLAAGDVLDNVIHAGSGLTMTTVNVQDNLLSLNFTAADDLSGGVDLTASATGLTTLAAAAAGGANAGVAAALDTLMANPATQSKELSDFLFALGTASSSQQVSDGLAQALPFDATQVTSNNMQGVNRIVQARQDENRGLSSGEGFIGNRKAWVKPLGSWADQKNRNGAFGYNAHTYGVALGADGELSQAARIGAAFAYSNSKVDGNAGTQSSRIDSYQFVLYGSNVMDANTEFNWQADYGYNQNKGSRYIPLAAVTAASSYNSESFHVGAGIGRTMPLSDVTSFTPSFRADYTSITDKAYTETGAGGLNLAVSGKTSDEFILAVDGKVAHKVSDSGTLIGNVGLGYDLNARQNAVTASFAGGGAAFTTTGINPPATVVRGGIGYVGNTDGGVEITARYDVEARTGFTGQTASVKARWAF
ncbi:MAG: autotransporter domain-containing protein [Gallionella sp.]|nr:autotransporter domain-containing protein [Gallionella sp.]